jgi:hypothetical protein
VATIHSPLRPLGPPPRILERAVARRVLCATAPPPHVARPPRRRRPRSAPSAAAAGRRGRRGPARQAQGGHAEQRRAREQACARRHVRVQQRRLAQRLLRLRHRAPPAVREAHEPRHARAGRRGPHAIIRRVPWPHARRALGPLRPPSRAFPSSLRASATTTTPGGGARRRGRGRPPAGAASPRAARALRARPGSCRRPGTPPAAANSASAASAATLAGPSLASPRSSPAGSPHAEHGARAHRASHL